MATPARNKTLICELCGAPLQSLASEEGCLNCLLSTGIEGEGAESSSLPNEPSARIYQHYEILTRPDGSLWELGRGAMGVTYKARDVNLETPVALKIINPRFSGQAGARRRFLQEAQAAAQLRHPNVASVFHFGTTNPRPNEGAATNAGENIGERFYATEFIEGESLAARLRRTGPLPPAVALEIALQVTWALAAAEKRGLVHRDLKPSNIMLVAEKETAAAAWVKVIDFGLARAEGDSSTASRFLGTLAFSSPEQVLGREVTGRSDIYSLSVTLCHALTGRVPALRQAGHPGDAQAGAPLPVAQLAKRGIPASIIALLESMLAPAPEDRPRSAVELGQSLQRTLDSLGRVSRVRRWVVNAGLGLAAGVVGLAIYLATLSPALDDKSIAVLPFRNLSSDPTNAFFAEGVQDDILSRLVKIRDLKVLSRLGTARYPADVPRDLPAIGRALGVRHLLEGRLRRAGDRVLLHVRLVDARDGYELWSQGYDRTLADAINLQGELASNIADALDATLSPHERAEVRKKSTGSPDAYVLYLEGRKFENSPPFAVSGYEAAERLYRQAVAVDPDFALAHARLASTLGLLYRFRGSSEELKERAHQEVRKALLLAPDLGEAHLAKALGYYRIERDYNLALPELEIARRLIPNDTEAEGIVAFIHRRRGQWKEARAGLEHVRARDPLNEKYEQELCATASLLRDWPAASRHVLRAIELSPTVSPFKIEQGMVDVWANGNLALLEKFFADFTAYGDPEGNVAWARWDAAMLSRDFVKAQGAIDGFPFETLPSVLSAPVPKTYLEGCLWLAQGRDDRAQEFFESTRPALEAEVRAHPGNALRHARLGLLYAYVGRKSDAIREGERAVRLTPVTEDAIDGHQWLCNLALILARVGEADRAVSMIEPLLREPGCISPLDEASLSLWELRLRWQWDPLRHDPRFQKILAAPEPATIF